MGFQPSTLVVGHHDLDGIVSAALAGAWLRERGHQVHFASIDFPHRGRWATAWRDLQDKRGIWPRYNRPDAPLINGLAIVDFLPTVVAPDAFLMFADHHQETFDDPALRWLYAKRARSGAPVFYDPDSGSCARLIESSLDLPRTLDAATLVRMAHRSDTAGHAAPNDSVDFKGSLLARLDLVALGLSEPEAASSMEALSRGRTMEAAVLDLHGPHRFEEAERAVEAYKGNLEFVSAHVAVYDFTATRSSPPRIKFAEFSDPRVHYAVQLRPPLATDDGAVVQGLVGRSPWASPPPSEMAHPDLAAITRTLAGGGGHPYAAGFQIHAPTIDLARREARAVGHLIAAHLHAVPVTHQHAARPTEKSPQAAPILHPLR